MYCFLLKLLVPENLRNEISKILFLDITFDSANLSKRNHLEDLVPLDLLLVS